MSMMVNKPDVRKQEDGYMLVGLIVAIFLILLFLGIAAPRVATELRREREVEAIHRGNEYVQAVRRYYKKNQHYPGSIEQLEKSNNIRFLRQRFVDPMTGKPDWKLIHVGEAKTTVKGFFGKPLSGLSGSGGGLGSAAGLASGGSVGAGAAGSTSGSGSSFGSSSFGSSSSSGSSFGSSSGSSGSSFGSSSFGSSGQSGTSGTGSGIGSGTSGSSGISSQSATSFTGTGAPIMGVGSAATGNSITVLNEQTTYPTWEFIYDPRIEALKAKASLLGGGPTSSSASGFGSSATSPGIGGSTTPGINGTGSTPGFGSGSSSGAGGFGSSMPTPTPQ